MCVVDPFRKFLKWSSMQLVSLEKVPEKYRDYILKLYETFGDKPFYNPERCASGLAQDEEFRSAFKLGYLEKANIPQRKEMIGGIKYGVRSVYRIKEEAIKEIEDFKKRASN